MNCFCVLDEDLLPRDSFKSPRFRRFVDNSTSVSPSIISRLLSSRTTLISSLTCARVLEAVVLEKFSLTPDALVAASLLPNL